MSALVDALGAGLLARRSSTSNDPRTLPGYLQWARTVRVLRDVGIPLGWRKSDENNFSLLVRDDSAIAIMVSSGCSNTGISSLTPTTKSTKGPNTDAAIRANGQLGFSFLDSQLHMKRQTGRKTWVLLYFVDSKEMRAELSLPFSFVDDRPLDWEERIILPPIPIESTISFNEEDFGPAIEIDVTRRT